MRPEEISDDAERRFHVAQLPMNDRRRVLARLATTLATLDVDQPQTWRLCEAIRRVLGADGAAITLEYGSESRTTICATDEVAEALENLQEVLGQGPGYDTANSDKTVVAHLDGDVGGQWPMLTQAVDGQFGSMNVYTVPLHAGNELSGVVTLYTRGDSGLREPLESAHFLSSAVGAALLADYHEHAQGEQLSGDWNNRAIVHQATGMVMAQLHCPPHDALAVLRGHAYALDTDVYDIAQRVVDLLITFSDLDAEEDR